MLTRYNSEDESPPKAPTPEDQVFQLGLSGKARQMRARLLSKLGEAAFAEILAFLAEHKRRRLSEDQIHALALERFGKAQRSVIFEVDQLMYLESPTH